MPSLFTLGVALVFLLPLVLVAVPLGRDAHGVFVWMQQARHDGIPPPEFLAKLPLVGAQATAWWASNLGDPEGASALLQRVGQGDLLAKSREFGAMLLHRIVLFGFTLLTLFFLFRDGERLAAADAPCQPPPVRSERRTRRQADDRLGAWHGGWAGAGRAGRGRLARHRLCVRRRAAPDLVRPVDRHRRDDPVRRAAAVRPRRAVAAGARIDAGGDRGARSSAWW